MKELHILEKGFQLSTEILFLYNWNNKKGCGNMKIQKWIARTSILGGFGLLLVFSFFIMKESVPDKIWMVQGEEENFNFHVPMTGVVEAEGLEVFGNQSPAIERKEIHVDLNKDFSMKSDNRGSYSIVCRLFGIFEVKEVAVEVIEEESVVPCGIPVGIYVKTEGVLIIGTGAVTGTDGMNYEPAANIVKSGDYIKTINEQVVKTKENVIEAINGCEGKSVVLGILRDGEYIELKVEPVKTGGNEYKLGIWIRDDLAGVGTLTFCDSAGNYGALGHPVSDMDTGTKVLMSEGTLYEAKIAGITKGEKGKPGEVSGIITYLDQFKLGTVEENTEVGIYGKLERMPEQLQGVEYCAIGMKQEVQEGPAKIVSYLSGERKEYDIEIIGMDYSGSNLNKGILFEVTDPELLELTGGIVQGMFTSYNGNNTRKSSKIKGLRCSSPISLTKKRLVFCARYN